MSPPELATMIAPAPETYAWRSRVKTPAGRLREMVFCCDPYGTSPPAIKLHLNEDAGQGGNVLAYCHSTSPAPWHVSLVGCNWQQAGETTGQILTSGSGHALQTLIHEFCHWCDGLRPALENVGLVPDPAEDRRGWLDYIHRAAFQRVNRLFRARALVGKLLVEVDRLEPREERTVYVPPADPADIPPPYPEPAGLWPDIGVDLNVFAGVSGVETFRLADAYASGFPPAPEGWAPECGGSVYAWPGGVYAWRPYRIEGDGAWCDRLPGGKVACLPSYALFAMERRP